MLTATKNSESRDITTDVEAQDNVSDFVDQVVATLHVVEIWQAMPNALLGSTPTSDVCLEKYW